MAKRTIRTLLNYLKSALIITELPEKLETEILLIIIKITNYIPTTAVKGKISFKKFQKKKPNLLQLQMLKY